MQVEAVTVTRARGICGVTAPESWSLGRVGSLFQKAPTSLTPIPVMSLPNDAQLELIRAFQAYIQQQRNHFATSTPNGLPSALAPPASGSLQGPPILRNPSSDLPRAQPLPVQSSSQLVRQHSNNAAGLAFPSLVARANRDRLASIARYCAQDSLYGRSGRGPRRRGYRNSDVNGSIWLYVMKGPDEDTCTWEFFKSDTVEQMCNGVIRRLSMDGGFPPPSGWTTQLSSNSRVIEPSSDPITTLFRGGETIYIKVFDGNRRQRTLNPGTLGWDYYQHRHPAHRSSLEFRPY